MEIVFSEERMPSPAIIQAMHQAGELCIKEKGLDSDRVSLSVTFVSNEEIRELNSVYRNIDATTDVLSFPQYNDINELPEEGEICLGDVVICTEQALLQADDYGHSPTREIVYLFVHSVFHLLGCDHSGESEQKEMRELEEKVMKQIGLER